MSGTEEHVQLIISGIDRGATKLSRDVAAGLKGVEGQAAKTASGVGRLTNVLDTLRGRIRAGFEFKIGADLEHFIGDLVGLIPRSFFGAIDAGQSYLETIREIVRVTGLNAEQASQWAAVMEHVGVPLGNVSQVLAMFGRNLAENEDLFVRLGIATRNQNGYFLDAYTILQNTRRAFAEHGAALANSGAAQELFSRSGYKLLEVLQLSDAQWAAYSRQAAAAGQIVGGAATDGVERFVRAQAGLQGVIQGIQTAIFTGLGPALESFVDGFTRWVEAHMQQIVDFVSSVANFVIGVIGGLFGIDFSAKTAEQSTEALAGAGEHAGKAFDGLAASTRKAADGEDAMTTALTAQIKGIDSQIAAIRRRSDALHAAEERARLDKALATAQSQLADLRGNAPFTEGLSNAEAVLARQKHAQDIIDAEQAVHDAQGSIAQFSADQQERREIDALQARKQRLQDELAAHKKTIQTEAKGAEWLTGVQATQDAAITKLAHDTYSGITAQAQEWRDNGVRFSNDVKGAIAGVMDALLGQVVNTQHGSWRTGGLIGALGGLAEVIGSVARFIGETVQKLTGLLPDVPKGTNANDWLWGPGGSPQQAAEDFWAQLIHTLSGGNLPGPTHHAAGGIAGRRGPELSWLGEKGPERVIPNDELDEWHRGGTPSNVTVGGPSRKEELHLHFHSIWPPTTEQARKLFDLLDERMQLKADNAPVGMPAFRGASG